MTPAQLAALRHLHGITWSSIGTPVLGGETLKTWLTDDLSGMMGGDTLANMVEELLRCDKVVVVGMGNILRGDDGIGIFIAKKLRKLVRGSKKVKVLVCEAGFENITHVLVRYKPKRLLIIDAVYVEGGEPGTIYVFGINDIDSNPTITTHHLPLKLVLDYLMRHLDVEVSIIGVQVGRIELGAKMSDEVLNAGLYLVNLFEEVLQKLSN